MGLGQGEVLVQISADGQAISFSRFLARSVVDYSLTVCDFTTFNSN